MALHSYKTAGLGLVYFVKSRWVQENGKTIRRWGIYVRDGMGLDSLCPGLGHFLSSAAAAAELKRIAEDNGMEDLGAATQSPTDWWRE